jgi:hypothetical protein
MTATNVKVDYYLKPWAVFFALSFVAITITHAIIGGIAGGISAMVGGARLIAVLAAGLGFLVSLPISYFCFRFAVSKFLLPKISTSTESTVEPLKAAA